MTITSRTPRDRSIPDHLCDVCRKACGFGIGFDEHAKWYCREHVPADFFAKDRECMPKGQSVMPIAPSSAPQGDLFGTF